MAAGTFARCLLSGTATAIVVCVAPAWAQTRVTFDIPDAIECRDVTPEKCRAEHPHLKAIEGKFRLSARGDADGRLAFRISSG